MKEKSSSLWMSVRAQEALQTRRRTARSVGMFKVGSQLFTAGGPHIVREIIDDGGKVFLDLKFHDIPNTVTHAAVEAAKLGVSMMTIHASGGRAMMESVSKALHDKFGSQTPIVVAVTVLTSLDTRALFEIGVEVPMEEQVERLALLAEECGIDGVVCSPREIRRCEGPSTRISRSSRRESACRISRSTISNASRLRGKRSPRAPTISSWAAAVTDDRDPRAAMQRLMESIPSN